MISKKSKKDINKKILFIIDRCSVEPLGIMYLSAMARKRGFQVALHQYSTDVELRKILILFSPLCVCFSMTTGQHVRLLEIAKKVKEFNKNITILAGGPHITFFPESGNEDYLDYIVRGEADFVFPELLERIALRIPIDGKDCTNLAHTPSDLDLIEFPDRRLVYVLPNFLCNPVKNILTARGCPFSCTYCYNSSELAIQSNRRVRYRSVDNIIRELYELIGVYGKYTKMVFFADDEFSVNAARLKVLAEEYKTYIKRPFHCQVRIDLVNEEKIRILKDMGCKSLTFAIESGNEDIRYSVLNRHMKNSIIIKNANLLKRYGIRYRIENMIGLPGESYKNVLETIQLNQKLRPDYGWVSIFQPYPGTILEKHCKKMGLSNGDVHTFDYLFSEDSVLKFPEDYKKKIRNIQRLFSLLVELPWLMLFLPLLLKLNLTSTYAKIRNYWKKYCYSRRIFRI